MRDPDVRPAPAPLTGRELALLVARAQSGERPALDALLRQVQAPLYRHIDAIVRDRTMADDVLQDVLIVVSRKLPGLRDPRWFRAWAYRIASRAAMRRARRSGDLFEALPDEWHEREGDEPESVDAALVREAVDRSVDALPPGSRLVVRMHYFDDLTINEIAEALEIPVGTVKSRLAYGLDVLRRRLDEGETPGGATPQPAAAQRANAGGDSIPA